MPTDQEVKQYPLWVQIPITVYVLGSVLFVFAVIVYRLCTDGLLWGIHPVYYWLAAPGVAVFFISELLDGEEF